MRTVRIEECCRYMGVRGEADERTRALAESCLEELEGRATPRHVMRDFPLTVDEAEGLVDLGCFTVHSRDLARNLAGCTKVLLFGATLGEGPDLLIRRYGRVEVSRGLAMQACSAAMIEAYCDELCAGWRSEYASEGYGMRPRFSPGYGDFDLSVQTNICDVLKTGKTIGVTLTDSLLMMPSKSVTAVVGLFRAEQPAQLSSGCVAGDAAGRCEGCAMERCPYRV